MRGLKVRAVQGCKEAARCWDEDATRPTRSLSMYPVSINHEGCRVAAGVKGQGAREGGSEGPG